jgi:16S rRNA (guanine(966)-N(2))-methyltransferase RsmD
MMVIAGKLRGRHLKGIPKGKEHKELRPILARIKKSLFDIIRIWVPGARFLDLYAGTGAVGIEALSRGAERAVFVDSDFIIAKSLKEDLARLGLQDCSAVYQRDIIRVGLGWLAGETAMGKFDIIFMGPPYKGMFINKTLEHIVGADLLAPDGIIIAQHHEKEKAVNAADSGAPAAARVFEIYRDEKYGDSVLTFIRKRKEKKDGDVQ